MRTWLRTGARGFVVDPRRRLGKHGGARKMLATDGEVEASQHGGWSGLVSALQRHTVHGELAQLSKDDRQILSLAYLSGHTNREIAAMLQVSVSTVSRRLSAALARLEDSMRRAGVWITTLALLGLAAYERLAQYVRNNRWPSTVALVAAGTATTVAITMVVAPSAASGARPATVSQRAQAIRVVTTRELPAAAVIVSDQPVTVAVDQPSAKAGNPSKHEASQPVVTASRICHGNPTSAPPPIPVGSPGAHPTGAPVTHPGPGGCGHLNK
jgi:DNA-binding CsgD family transcriptional regulator